MTYTTISFSLTCSSACMRAARSRTNWKTLNFILFSQPFLLRCYTCSLVSSSGQLLNSSAGHKIDQSDCIIRMNDAPTVGFEKDVGSRTTIRVIGHSNLKPILSNPNNPVVGSSQENSENVVIAWLYKTNIYKDFAYTAVLNFSQVYRNVNFFTQTPEMMKANNQRFWTETGITRSVFSFPSRCKNCICKYTLIYFYHYISIYILLHSSLSFLSNIIFCLFNSNSWIVSNLRSWKV